MSVPTLAQREDAIGRVADALARRGINSRVIIGPGSVALELLPDAANQLVSILDGPTSSDPAGGAA